MTSIVLDIDDTLVSTDRRMQTVWRQVLGREVPLEAVKTLGLEQVFMKFASPEQKTRAIEFQRRFWDIVLCVEDVGVESFRLHEPIPFAVDVLQKWSKQWTLVYLTGRIENARDLTLRELRNFGFPIHGTRLLMFSLEDYARMRGESPSGPTLVDAKARLFSSVSKKHDVIRVVDDYPGYFPIYRQSGVPERIGFLHPKRYLLQDYIEQGATKVVESWRELQNGNQE